MANILSTIPINGSGGAYRNEWIEIYFDKALDQSTIKPSTVLLTKTSDNSVVNSAPVWYAATKKIQIRITVLMAASTNYTVRLIGGKYGIKELITGAPFNVSGYNFSFTTGTLTDKTKPLAETSDSGATGWSGSDGIYTEVHERTGEPISHITTDSTTIGPSGYIGPGVTPDYYIVPEAVSPFAVVSTFPEDDEAWVDVTSSGILIEFNHPLKSSWNFDSSVSGVQIEYSDILGYDIATPLTFTYMPINERLAIATTFRESTEYTVTISSLFGSTVATAGTLGEDYEIYFRTSISPYFSSVKIMRSLLGTFISSIDDFEIERIIYENSLRAIEISAEGTTGTVVATAPTAAAKNYVKCTTQLDLIMRAFAKDGDVSTKQLGDFLIRFGNNIDRKLKKKIDDLSACATRNELLLKYGTTCITPKTPVKAGDDPRHPTWIRLPNTGGFK